MKKEFKGYIGFAVAVMMVFMLASGAIAGKKASSNLPNNIKDLTAVEKELQTESKSVSDELFKVLTDIRMEQTRVTKSDPEIKALNAEISKLRAKVAELTLAKSKSMSEWSKKRDTLVAQHDDLRKKLMAIKIKKAEVDKK